MKLTTTLSLVAVLATGGFLLGRRHAPQTYVSHYENVMGTSLELKLLARSDAQAAQAEQSVLDEIARESRILSSYDPSSEFSQWMRTSQTAARVSPELFEILDDFDLWRSRTGGALDPSAEAVTRVWKAAASESRVPTARELAEAVSLIQQQHWRLERASLTAMHTSQAPIALNSFTKSYIVDRAARRALAVSGVTGVLVNVGGDMVVRGDWTQTVGVTNPLASADNGLPLGSLIVRDRAIASSGGYKRGFDIAGQHYSHIVDPRTGQPTGHVLGATVVAPNAVDAGALATAFCVLSPEDSQVLAQTVPGAEFVIVLSSGRRVESAGWRALEQVPARRSLIAPAVGTLYAADQSTWSAGWELTLSFELARFGGMSKRPYLAAWVEDADHFPVRTISMWFDNKGRYLPELRAWYRADRLRSMAEGTQILNTVTSATRTAGAYTLQWDGKDNAGKYVKNGTYTVFLEVAREHGTYQLLKQEMELAGVPKSVTLPPGSEVTSATFDYHKVNGR